MRKIFLLDHRNLNSNQGEGILGSMFINKFNSTSH